MVEGLKFKIYYSHGMNEVECFDWPCLLGRSTECHVRLKDPGVSRKHLEIKKENNKLWIRNLTGSNSTSINNIAMLPGQFIEITEQDKISFSQVEDFYFKVEKIEENKMGFKNSALENKYSFEEDISFSEDDTVVGLSLIHISEPTRPY